MLTDGDTAVGATEVDVALRDGRHAQLVVGPGEECCEGAGKHHITVPYGATYRHAHLQKEERERETELHTADLDQINLDYHTDYHEIWFPDNDFDDLLTFI